MLTHYSPDDLYSKTACGAQPRGLNTTALLHHVTCKSCQASQVFKAAMTEAVLLTHAQAPFMGYSLHPSQRSGR